MIFGVEQLFICLLATYSNLLSTLKKAVLLLSYKNSLYVLDTNPLIDMCFANIFSQIVARLFILLMSFTKHMFLMKSSYLFFLSWMKLFEQCGI